MRLYLKQFAYFLQVLIRVFSKSYLEVVIRACQDNSVIETKKLSSLINFSLHFRRFSFQIQCQSSFQLLCIFVVDKMKKSFVSAPKNYRKFCDSLSDSEFEVRRNSCDNLHTSFAEEFEAKCSVGDGLKKLMPARSGKTSPPRQSRQSTSPRKTSPNRSSAPSKANTSKAFKPMKIRDEVKIDLRTYEQSDRASLRSACKIYPIDEVSENASRASSKMRVEQNKKRQEVQRIMEENKSRARCRPTGNANKYPSIMQTMHDEVEIYKQPLFYRSSQSIVESVFEDHPQRSPSTSPPGSEDRYDLYNRFGSITSFKRAQIHKLSNDSIAYQERREQHLKKFDDSYQDLMTIRTYSSSDIRRPSSCFGCFTKPFAKMCRKSRKY